MQSVLIPDFCHNYIFMHFEINILLNILFCSLIMISMVCIESFLSTNSHFQTEELNVDTVGILFACHLI